MVQILTENRKIDVSYNNRIKEKDGWIIILNEYGIEQLRIAKHKIEGWSKGDKLRMEGISIEYQNNGQSKKSKTEI